MKSKNWLISIFALIIMVTIIAVTVVVTVNNKKTNLNEKLSSEIDYLDKTMIAMVNKLNNLQTSDEIHAKRTSVEISSQNIMTDSSKSGEESSSNSNGSKMGGTDSSGSSNSNKALEVQEIHLPVQKSIKFKIMQCYYETLRTLTGMNCKIKQRIYISLGQQ